MSITRFTGKTTLDIPAETILKGAIEEKITDAVVIGYDPKGDLYFASSNADGAEVLWLLQRAIHKLMHVMDELDGSKS